MRTITFYTHNTSGRTLMCKNYADTLMLIKDGVTHVHTTQIALISFDLLEHFDKIFLNVNGEVYALGLGNTNTWTDKNLRVEHNLLKIVTAHFLTDL
jgi:hypothetical protein